MRRELLATCAGGAKAAQEGGLRHDAALQSNGRTQRVEVNWRDMKKKLIEVALPLEAINKEAVREAYC